MGTSKMRRYAVASVVAAATFVGGAVVGRISALTAQPKQAGVHAPSDNADLRLLLRAQQARR
jgi:hypothetical protein